MTAVNIMIQNQDQSNVILEEDQSAYETKSNYKTLDNLVNTSATGDIFTTDDKFKKKGTVATNDVSVKEFAVESEASRKQQSEIYSKEFQLVEVNVNNSENVTTESTGEKIRETMSQKSIGQVSKRVQQIKSLQEQEKQSKIHIVEMQE